MSGVGVFDPFMRVSKFFPRRHWTLSGNARYGWCPWAGLIDRDRGKFGSIEEAERWKCGAVQDKEIFGFRRMTQELEDVPWKFQAALIESIAHKRPLPDEE